MGSKAMPRAPPLSHSLTWQELQGLSHSPGSSPEQKKTGILGSALGAAANVFRAIGNPDKGRLQSTDVTAFVIFN